MSGPGVQTISGASTKYLKAVCKPDVPGSRAVGVVLADYPTALASFVGHPVGHSRLSLLPFLSFDCKMA
jgi:hypothetical protein